MGRIGEWTRRIAFLTAVGVAAATADSAVPGGGRSLGEARFETTPGKPMELARPEEPAERVSALRVGKRIELIAARNVGKEYQEGRADLSLEEWKRIEEVVVDRRLWGWQARETGERAFDYSTTRYALRTADGKVYRDQQWSQPVADAEKPRALAQVLGRLAKEKVKVPVLYYITD